MTCTGDSHCGIPSALASQQSPWGEARKSSVEIQTMVGRPLWGRVLRTPHTTHHWPNDPVPSRVCCLGGPRVRGGQGGQSSSAAAALPDLDLELDGSLRPPPAPLVPGVEKVRRATRLHWPHCVQGCQGPQADLVGALTAAPWGGDRAV